MTLCGPLGETLATEYLKKQGYLVMKRNVKISYYEIDIIASLKGKICFIEVKTKASPNQYWEPENLINHQKMIDFKKAVTGYCTKNKLKLNEVALEVITITLSSQAEPVIKHYQDII